jgi:hypothetical protein
MARILTADVIQTTDGRTLNTTYPSGTVISSAIIRNGTRTALSNTSMATLFSGTFNKVLGANESYLIVRASVFGAGYSSGNCGVGCYIDSTNNWDYGASYQYDGSWSSTNQITTIIGIHVFTGYAAGARTIGFGWKTANGSATDRPFVYFNPNNSDDGRLNQVISSMYVQEVVL